MKPLQVEKLAQTSNSNSKKEGFGNINEKSLASNSKEALYHIPRYQADVTPPSGLGAQISTPMSLV